VRFTSAGNVFLRPVQYQMMKKIILFVGLLIGATCSFAQQAKTTATGDTSTLSNISVADTARMLYTHAAPGAGYVAGTNSYNDQAFAERYDFNHNDTSVNVIGVIAQFGGSVSASSAKTITLKVWRQGNSVNVGDHLYFSGFPTDMVDSLVVPFTDLGIGATKQFMFPYGSDFLTGGFFVGYTMSYNYSTLAGDTIGLMSSLQNHRSVPGYTLKYTIGTAGDTTAIDTFITVQNATQWSNAQWHDNYSQNDSLYNNLAIFPIVVTGHAAGIKGITRNQLTLFGAYPNPAYSNTNIRFTIATDANVSVSITDMSGRLVVAENEVFLAAGEHTVAVNTNSLTAGEYIYLIRTSGGDGMAGKFVVVK
jgi:hypothetical protein